MPRQNLSTNGDEFLALAESKNNLNNKIGHFANVMLVFLPPINRTCLFVEDVRHADFNPQGCDIR
jgi:hypothetical protein